MRLVEVFVFHNENGCPLIAGFINNCSSRVLQEEDRVDSGAMPSEESLSKWQNGNFLDLHYSDF